MTPNFYNSDKYQRKKNPAATLECHIARIASMKRRRFPSFKIFKSNKRYPLKSYELCDKQCKIRNHNQTIYLSPGEITRGLAFHEYC